MKWMPFIKGIYQTIVIRTSLWLASRIAIERDPKALVKKILAARNFEWNKKRKTKVFAIFALNNWESVFLEPLRIFGELCHFNWTDGKLFFENKELWQDFHRDVNRKLQDTFHEFYEADADILVFIYASDFSISKESLECLSRTNSLLVSFCWDDLLYFHGKVKDQPVGVKQISRVADINLTLSPEAIIRYQALNRPCFFWNSLPLNRMGNYDDLPVRNTREFYILFIGSNYGWRSEFIARLVQKGFRVICYGNGWPNGPISDEEIRVAVRNAAVTLGFSNVGYTKNVTTIKGRDFEVPLSGGLYLTQFSKGLADYFILGKEVLAYRSFSECIQQIEFIKNHPELAMEIRKAGYHKAKRFCTWESRFAYLQQLISKVTL